jgi:Zn-finger nucleic acid-binding protein
MKCPVDDRELVMSERHGIEIDYCPTCRGVWLDRGELDKIIERSSGARLLREHHGEDRGRFGRKKKKESFLSELFEFGE